MFLTTKETISLNGSGRRFGNNVWRENANWKNDLRKSDRRSLALLEAVNLAETLLFPQLTTCFIRRIARMVFEPTLQTPAVPYHFTESHLNILFLV